MIYLLGQDDVEAVFVSDVPHLQRLQQRGLSDQITRGWTMRELDCTNQESAARAFKGYDCELCYDKSWLSVNDKGSIRGRC
jgi:hypothetical protein